MNKQSAFVVSLEIVIYALCLLIGFYVLEFSIVSTGDFHAFRRYAQANCSA